jgi:hypothetical protein
MKKIIDDLLAMQKTDYLPDSMGYQVLDKAIQTLRRYDTIDNPGAISGTITVGSPDIHWEKHL